MKNKLFMILIVISIILISIGFYFYYNNKNRPMENDAAREKKEQLYYQGEVSPSGSDKPIGTG